MANTTITVNVAESQNYLATSKTISVSSGTKQQGYINLSENSVTMTGQSGNLYYVNITSYSGGTLSVSSSNTSVVTATVYSPQSNPAIELTLVGSGNATITVTVGETSTYTSATATISVTANVVQHISETPSSIRIPQSSSPLSDYTSIYITVPPYMEFWVAANNDLVQLAVFRYVMDGTVYISGVMFTNNTSSVVTKRVDISAINVEQSGTGAIVVTEVDRYGSPTGYTINVSASV